MTALGFGFGNLNDSMLDKIGNAGDGIYSVIMDATHADRYAEHDLLASLLHVAGDLKIQVDGDPVAGPREVAADELVQVKVRYKRVEDADAKAQEVARGLPAAAVIDGSATLDDDSRWASRSLHLQKSWRTAPTLALQSSQSLKGCSYRPRAPKSTGNRLWACSRKPAGCYRLAEQAHPAPPRSPRRGALEAGRRAVDAHGSARQVGSRQHETKLAR